MAGKGAWEMSMSEQALRKIFDLASAKNELVQLHEHVARHDGRVEIVRQGSDDRCVLISKRELEALERALEILSNTEDMRHVGEKIAQLVAAATSEDYAAV